MSRVAIPTVFVVVCFAVGVLFGVGHAMPTCRLGEADLGPVLAGNLTIALLLMSGVVCWSVSTVLIGIFAIGGTGATVGAILDRFQWQGVALLAPHGVLEFLACVLAVRVGLTPVLTAAGLQPRGSDRPTARLLVAACVVVVLAAVVETLWTRSYGPTLHC